MHALTFSSFGGPEVLAYREVPDPALLPGHALVRTRAIGLNFADVYRRKGEYHLRGEPPYIAGYEAAGVLDAVAGDVPLPVGARVAFADSPFANAELVAVPFDRLIPLPDFIDFDTAAALLLQGLTAQYLVRDSHRVAPGERVLVHAAAGGVGLCLTQMATQLGAHVLGVVSRADKAPAVRDAGAEQVALYSDDWVQAAYAFAPSADEPGVDVAYDSVGSTLARTLAAVRPRGHVVFYGFAGGAPAPVDPRALMDASKTLTGGDLWSWLRTREDRLSRAAELFRAVREGELCVRVAARVPLSEGARAHALLESRATSGKVLLIP